MGIQFTGLASGLDTQSIIADLMKVENMKVENVEKEKTRMEWKKDAWDDMNSKLYSFYKDDLFKFKSNSTYMQKELTSSNESVVSLNASSSAVNGSHTVTINKMAKGSQLNGTNIDSSVTASTTMAELVALNDPLADPFTGSATLHIKSKSTDSFDASNEITIAAGDTVADLIDKIKDLDLGINVNFDTAYNTLFMSSTATGLDTEISISDDDDANSNAILKSLGLGIADYSAGVEQSVSGNTGDDASFTYNGVTLTSSSNEISVNGLNFDIRAESGTSTIAVTTNTDAIYDSVKGFLNSFNELLAEMNTKIGADSARDYNVLTDDEKAAMTDDEVELWEKTIKDSLLRRDDTLTSIRNEMKSVLTFSSGVNTTDMDYKYFSFLGIVTGDYTEEGLLHIEGDTDDPLYSLKDNKLRTAIENDADGVMEFLTSVGQKLYDSMNERMKSSTLSSSLTFYNDKYMDNMVEDYEDEIYDLEDMLATVESRYYSQFTAMEQAIQQSNSTGDWLAQQLGAL